jgi:hypothetical protein
MQSRRTESNAGCVVPKAEVRLTDFQLTSEGYWPTPASTRYDLR